jgi:1-acyl-sn-glycerol-3-phosphate acyltransferase
MAAVPSQGTTDAVHLSMTAAGVDFRLCRRRAYLRRILAWPRAGVALLLVSLNTIFHCTPLFLIALVKALVRSNSVRRLCDRALVGLAESWIGVNSWLIEHGTRTRVIVEGLQELDYHGRYLIFANHQSWVDIPILQKALNRRAPFMRFFLKSQLIWVPVLGLAWWALDFPFMKRYTRSQISARPELAGVDVQATRRACERFAHTPVSIMNFVEGTRNTPAKHARQQSPYRHLLKPRAGGIAFVLAALGDSLHSIVDVTVVYPGGQPSMLDLLSDRVEQIRVHIQVRQIPAEFLGLDYHGDPECRERFQIWLNELWREKDERIMRVLASSGLRAEGTEQG